MWAKIEEKPLPKRTAAIQFLVASAVLVAARLLFDLASATETVYPEYQFGQKPLALGVLVICVLAALFFAGLRFTQRQWLLGLALLVLVVVPFVLPRLIDPSYWKFQINRPRYLLEISTDQSRTLKYHVFNWGNRNTAIGGGVIMEAIVYDEADQIALEPELRSPDWAGGSAGEANENRWIIESGRYPSCARHVKRFDVHFYYVVVVC